MKKIKVGTSAEQIILIHQAMSSKMPCVLCGGKPHVVGVFAPYSKKFLQHCKLGSIVVYSLCRKCNKKKDKLALIDDAILQDLAAESN
jgi:hypothetical protein